MLVQKLKRKFPTHSVMDVFGIMYPQYWLQPNHEASLPEHLEVIKIAFYYGKTQLLDGVENFGFKVLNVNDFDNQQGMFKLNMTSNVVTCMAPPFDTNPLTNPSTLGDNTLDINLQLPRVCEIG